MKNGLRETLADVSIPLVKIPAHPVRAELPAAEKEALRERVKSKIGRAHI